MRAPKEPPKVTDLSAYRTKKQLTTRRREPPPSANDDKLIETITYHLLMAARAIEARKH